MTVTLCPPKTAIEALYTAVFSSKLQESNIAWPTKDFLLKTRVPYSDAKLKRKVQSSATTCAEDATTDDPYPALFETKVVLNIFSVAGASTTTVPKVNAWLLSKVHSTKLTVPKVIEMELPESWLYPFQKAIPSNVTSPNTETLKCWLDFPASRIVYCAPEIPRIVIGLSIAKFKLSDPSYRPGYSRTMSFGDACSNAAAMLLKGALSVPVLIFTDAKKSSLGAT
mmetsp:Transcript_17200/g.22684  ORF Transcript_17200/g.22684 Transcript_17200/m.22684 type:complete len:225 (+) Transcript_17200:412-1086(+)